MCDVESVILLSVSGVAKGRGGGGGDSTNPKIPNETRWNLQLACAETFLTNFYKYTELLNEDTNIATLLSN